MQRSKQYKKYIITLEEEKMFHAVKVSTSLNVTQHTWVIYMHLKGCRKLNTMDLTYCYVFPPD